MVLNKDGLFKVIEKYGLGFYTLYEVDGQGLKGDVLATHSGTVEQITKDLEENFGIFKASRFIIELKQSKNSNGDAAIKTYTLDMNMGPNAPLAGIPQAAAGLTIEQLEGFRDRLKTNLMEETKVGLQGLYDKAAIEINTMKQIAVKDLEIEALKREIGVKDDEIADLKEEIRDLERKFDSKTDQFGSAIAKAGEMLLKGYGFDEKFKSIAGNQATELPDDANVRM